MSTKQWGHGYIKGNERGKEQGFVKGLEKGFDNMDEYANARNDFKNENLFKHFKTHVSLVCICPFHSEKTPSCMYKVLEDRFFCLSCGEEGTGMDLAIGISNMD